MTKIDENTLLALRPEFVISNARKIPTTNSRITEPATSKRVTWIADQKIESENNEM